jgi:hypothetical protein
MPSPLGKAFGVSRIAKQQFVERYIVIDHERSALWNGDFISHLQK